MSKKTAAEDQAPELDLDAPASAEADQDQQPDTENADPVSEARDYLARGGSKAAAQDDEEDQGSDEETDQDDGQPSEEDSDDQPTDEPSEEGEADAEEDLAAMPEEVRERTRQRFEKLNHGFQQLQQQHETLNQDHQTLISAITETGMDSQQFGQVLDFVSAVNSNEPQDLQRARDMLQAQLREINLRLGDEDTLLSGFEDLQQAVDNLDITREHALELAKARSQQQRAQQRQQQQPPAPQHDQAPQSEVTPDMVQRLNQIGANWQATDLAFSKKWPVLMERLEGLYARTRPEALEQALNDEWERIGKELAQQQRSSARQQGRRQRPLSGGGGGAQGAVDHKDPVAGARAYLSERFGRS